MEELRAIFLASDFKPLTWLHASGVLWLLGVGGDEERFLAVSGVNAV